MITDLKPYVEYKESGSKWLGQVPGHLVVFADHAVAGSGINEVQLHQTATGALMAGWHS